MSYGDTEKKEREKRLFESNETLSEPAGLGVYLTSVVSEQN